MIDLETKLSENFKLRELIFSDTAARRGINNTPNEQQVIWLRQLAEKFESCRSLLGRLHVNSAFRCLELNRAIGSKDTSQHIITAQYGAGDLISLEGHSPIDMCKIMASSGIQFDQLIYEYRSWMHISFRFDNIKPRHSIITINEVHPTGINGIVE